jgi:hypothetical protein
MVRPRSVILRTRCAKALGLSLTSGALCLAMASFAMADFSVVYRAKSATLLLFNQPQPSPFLGVEAKVFVQGNKVRFEGKDHWGRTHVWITDRATREVIHLFENHTYALEQGGWSCDLLPAQCAAMLASGLAQAGIDSLSISGGEKSVRQGVNVLNTHWVFRAQVFGLPQAVWITATVSFPEQEATVFGPQASELYCGKKPTESAWQTAFDKYLRVSPDSRRTLARTIRLPMALDFKTELGVGSATLLLEATEFSGKAQDAGLFRIPAGYHPADSAE